MVQAFVGGDPQQPGPHGGSRLEGGSCLPGCKEHVLGDVLCSRSIGDPEEPVDELDDRPVMQLHERTESLPIALAGDKKQGCVVLSVRHGLFSVQSTGGGLECLPSP